MLTSKIALGGTLSSYTWICMIINFLQTRSPPILPSLHQIPRKSDDRTQRIESTFADSLDSLRGYGNNNKQTLGQLLFHFFRYYSFEVNYDDFVVSVRHGRLLSRNEKGWDASSLSKEGRDRLCVEEPINTSRNLGNSADPTAFRGIHLEIRRAFTLIGEGQLDKACEQYEFPAEEKVTFKKPPSQPRPALLTRSNSQSSKSTKGVPNGRGGRNPLRNNGSNPRRASSGATRPLFAQSPPLGPSGAEQFSQSNLHDHLYQRYQLLQLQQESLKAQAQLMAQAQAQARLHKQAQSSQLPSRGGSNSISEGTRSTKQSSSPQLMASDRQLQAAYTLFPGYVYQYPSAYEIVHGGQPPAAHEGASSNPSSPGLAHATPTNRRGLHRNPNVNELSSGTIRSHSQPARRGPGLMSSRLVFPPGYDTPKFVQFAGPANAHQHSYEMPMNMTPAYATVVPASSIENSNNARKEYVGYYLNEASALPPTLTDFTMQHALPRDIAQRRRRATPELQAPKLSAPFRHASRSPSPLGHHRSFSTGLRTAPLPASSSSSSSSLHHQQQQHQQRQHSEDVKSPLPSLEDYRPVIVNGSTPTHGLEAHGRSGNHEVNGTAAVPLTYKQPSIADERLSADYSDNHFHQIIYDDLAAHPPPPLQYRIPDSSILTSPKTGGRGTEFGQLINDVNVLEDDQQHAYPRGLSENVNSPLICSSSASSSTMAEPDAAATISKNLPLLQLQQRQHQHHQQLQQPSPHLALPSRNASIHANPNDPFVNGPVRAPANASIADRNVAIPAFPQIQTRGHPPRSINNNAIPLKAGLSALDLARARLPVETISFAKQAALSGVAGNAVLSPVFETRTPSPSSVWKDEGSKTANGFKRPAGSGSGRDVKGADAVGVSGFASGDGTASASTLTMTATTAATSAATIAPATPAIASSNFSAAADSRLSNRTNGITPSNATATPNAIAYTNSASLYTASPTSTTIVATPLDKNNNKPNLPRKENFTVPPIPARKANDAVAASIAAAAPYVNNVNTANSNVSAFGNNVGNGNSNANTDSHGSSNTNPWQRSVSNKKSDRKRSKSSVYAAAAAAVPEAVIANGTTIGGGGTSGSRRAGGRDGTAEVRGGVGDVVRMEIGGGLKGG